MELTLSLLVEKLIIELKRLKKDSPNLNLQLEDDVKLIFFTELDQGSNLVSGDFNGKLKSFADTVYRKFESLGSWSIDHQMMLNSFLQERFLMANLVKNANLEIEKAKTISVRRDESVKKYESEIGLLEGYISKIRSSLQQGGVSAEQDSVLNNIFREFDTYITTRIVGEPVRMLGELAISDARIQSLIREKDAEILRLRDRIFAVEKSRSVGSTSDSANKIIEVLRGENLKLKNELAQLHSLQGSAELIAGYKTEITNLQQRNLELEQTISNLRADLANYRKENEVGIKIYESNVKDSGVTGLDARSQSSSFHMSSPASEIKMVESSYRGTGDSNIRGSEALSAAKSREPTYASNLGDSKSGIKQEASYGTSQKDAPNRSTFQSDDRGSYDSRFSSSTQGAQGFGNTATSRYGTGSGISDVSGTGTSGYTSPQSGSSYSSQSGSSYTSGQAPSSYTGQTGTGYAGYSATGATYGQQPSSLSGSGTGSGYTTSSRTATFQGPTGTTGYTGYTSGTGAVGGATGTTGATNISGTSAGQTQGGSRFGTTSYSSSYRGQSGQGGQGR
jgi:hypothetical protein